MAESVVREAVGIFEDAESFQAAIDELLSHGFDRAEISVLARDEAIMEKLGHLYVRPEEIEDDPDVPRTAYVSTESIGDAEGAAIGVLSYVPAAIAGGAVVASGGALVGALSAAALAGCAGSLLGAMMAEWLGADHAAHLKQQLDRGGLLLWVNLRDLKHEAQAVRILAKHSNHAVNVHTLPAGST